MWLNGTRIDLTKDYSVTVNSFLASGGDNFWELADGTRQEDTEQTDLAAQVDFMKQYQSDALPVDYNQRGVRVTFPDDAPDTYAAGDTVNFDLSSLLMTGPNDVQDTSLTIKDGDTVLADDVPVTPSNSTQPYDDRGSASVSVTLPDGVAGNQVLTVYGNQAGDGTPEAYIKIPGVKVDSTVTAEDQDATYGSAGSLTASVSGPDGPVANPGGTMTFSEGDDVLGTADVGADGTATLDLTEVTLGAGDHTITAELSDSDAFNDGASTTFTLTVAKAPTTVVSDDASVAEGSDATIPVTVTSSATAQPDGTVQVLSDGTSVGTATLVDGAATVDVDTSTLATGANTVTVSYSGADNFESSSKDITLTITVAPQTATVTAPKVTVHYGKKATLPITVKGSAGTPTGHVQVRYGTKSLGTVTLSHGKATLTLAARSLAPGGRALSLRYGGDGVYAAATGATKVTVLKATAKISDHVVHGPIRVKKKGPKLYVAVRATGVTATGKVTLLIRHKKFHGTLRKGHVSIKLPKFPKAGKVKVTITYAGDAHVAKAKKVVKVKVKRKR
jgi:5'-nucleotidase